MSLNELMIPKEEYHVWEETIDEEGKKEKRTAIIQRVNNHFSSCEFSFSGKYSLGDWRFLKKLAERIIQLEDKTTLP